MKPDTSHFSLSNMTVTVHFGIYNRDLAEAVVKTMPKTINNYWQYNQDYKFDIADDGEFVAYTYDYIGADKIRSLIHSRLAKYIKKTKNSHKDFISNDLYDGYRLRPSYRYSSAYDWNTMFVITSDIAPGYAFNTYFTAPNYKISRSMFECFVNSLKKGMTQTALTEKYGQEMVSEMIGQPFNPIQQMNVKLFENEFNALIKNYEMVSKKIREASRNELKGHDFEETPAERDNRLLRMDKAIKVEQEMTFEKVQELRKKFGV